MSKVKVTMKLDNLKQKIKRIANELKQDEFGDHIRDQIVEKIRNDAFRFKTGKQFKRLAPITIENRKKLSKYNKTHPDYSPSKPNLTFTGRLLNSVKARITSKASSIILKIDVSGSHAPYKYKGKEVGKRVSNKSIREGLASNGRDPLELSKKAKRNLSRIITAIIKERLNK